MLETQLMFREQEPEDGTEDKTGMHLVFSWEEDRKIVLRIWSLIFSILATLMLFSMIEGRMAYVQGPYTGYVRFWTDCKRHKCASLGRVTVLIHMSQGFMILALALCIFLLPCMGLSFWSVFHRLNKIDSVFSSLSISIGPTPEGSPTGSSVRPLPADTLTPEVWTFCSLSPGRMAGLCGPIPVPSPRS
ncbi:hypothetical protein H920_12329 [Fukomys damarensis]|uniref:Uncharacterized protein n=1 Tax=Fukomys damarensis TaxID=885580 RepID=A0A091D555_FUKDA|nr:hypothetical protein H920_12329 [Fukomys damarensis]